DARGGSDLQSITREGFFGETVAALRRSRERKLDHSGAAQSEKLSRWLQARSLARPDKYRPAICHRRTGVGHLRSRSGCAWSRRDEKALSVRVSGRSNRAALQGSAFRWEVNFQQTHRRV